MNLIYKKPLITAIAVSLGVVSPLVWGGVVLTDSSTALSLWADEAKESTSLEVTSVNTDVTNHKVWARDLAVAIPNIPIGYAVSQAQSKVLTVRLSLTTGAYFTKGTGSGATLVCINYTAVATNTTHSASSLLWSDVEAPATTPAFSKSAIAVSPTPALASNTSNLLFAIPDGFVASDKGCILTFSAQEPFAGTPVAGESAMTALTLGGGTNDVKLTTQVTFQELFQNKTVTAAGTIINFVPAIAGSVAPKTSSGVLLDPVIDVKYNSQKFIKQVDGVKLLPNDLQKIVVGNVAAEYVNKPAAGAAAKFRAASGGEVSAFDITTTNKVMSAVNVVLSGPTIAAASKVSLNRYGTCAVGDVVVGGTPVLTTSGTSGTVSDGSITLTIAQADVAKLNSGLDVCIEVDGTKLISEGQVTATLTGYRKNGLTTFEIGTGSLATVRRNGVVLRILNIPNSTNADQAFIRFYNTSSQDINITGTLYGQDGKSIGTPNSSLFAPLKAHDVEILDAAKLAGKVGATAPWTGRAWLTVQAETAPELLKVQSLVRSPTGVLINLSTDAVD